MGGEVAVASPGIHITQLTGIVVAGIFHSALSVGKNREAQPLPTTAQSNFRWKKLRTRQLFRTLFYLYLRRDTRVWTPRGLGLGWARHCGWVAFKVWRTYALSRGHAPGAESGSQVSMLKVQGETRSQAGQPGRPCEIPVALGWGQRNIWV